MSTDALGYTLGLITVAMTMVAVKKNNMLLSLGTAALWAGFLNFILSELTDGTTMQEMLIVGFIVFIIAVPLLTFASGRRAKQLTAKGYYTSESGENIIPRSNNEPQDIDKEEAYRRTVHRSLRRSRYRNNR